jgi:hypothetical protein
MKTAFGMPVYRKLKYTFQMQLILVSPRVRRNNYGKKPGIQHAKWQKTESLEISGEWSRKEHSKDEKQKLANCEVTPQAIWPIAKSLTKRGGPKAPSADHGLLGPIFCSVDKINIIADCLENQFTAYDVIATIGDMWSLKLKTSWLQSMKTSLFISDTAASQIKYIP